MNIPYIALVMDNNYDLLVYTGKGRPSREETETIKADGNSEKCYEKVVKT